MPLSLYRRQELAFRTQYAELKERSASVGTLLPGTPGRLVLRTGTGYRYWYRSYYAVPGQPTEDFVCKDSDESALAGATQAIAFADWAARQVRDLRKLEFQVADKAAARVLVELHNRGLFDGGLVVVGTLAFMAWLNELGAKAVVARTQDIDLARRQALKLAAPVSFLDTVKATKLRFSPVPGLAPDVSPTSVKLAGAEGLRIDVLAEGRSLGRVVEIPELAWHAQSIPHLDFLLSESRWAALLAGGSCVPVRLPAPERFLLHKLYSSVSRTAFPEKARKDLMQAATMAAVLVEDDGADLAAALDDAPSAVRSAARSRLPALRGLLANHAQAIDEIERALSP